MQQHGHDGPQRRRASPSTSTSNSPVRYAAHAAAADAAPRATLGTPPARKVRQGERSCVGVRMVGGVGPPGTEEAAPAQRTPPRLLLVEPSASHGRGGWGRRWRKGKGGGAPEGGVGVVGRGQGGGGGGRGGGGGGGGGRAAKEIEDDGDDE